MRAVDCIIKKRSGAELSAEEIRFLIDGYVDGSIPEYQISAFLMAVFFQGMSPSETSILTSCMIESGEVIDLSDLESYGRSALVDKHSTGGVGDKVSLILAPIVAAAGAQVPMMSGRGLGHTGGTLDKLESMPGYRTGLSKDEFRSIIQQCGFAMTGQTSSIVPADKKLYALRDVTGTVESIPLITASILSKKFAEGAQHLVFDVKYGCGAFMKTPEQAAQLAQSLVRVGKELGRGVTALITAMDIPLGAKVGNFLEVEESIDCLECRNWEANNEGTKLSLTGEAADLMEVTLHLSAWMLQVSGVAQNFAEGLEKSLEVLRTGSALEKFWQNVSLQGGDRQATEALRGSRKGLIQKDLLAPSSGYLRSLDAYRIGNASVMLGAGRNVASDDVLPDVGLIIHHKPGARLEKGQAVISLYARDEASMTAALQYLENVVDMDVTEPRLPEVIHSVIN